MRTSVAAIAVVAVLAGGVSACTPAESNDFQPPPPASAVDDPAEVAPVEEATTTKAPKPAKVKMPSVEGTNLQVTANRLERKGFTNIEPLPVDGHAFAANYANWVITGQSPAAGKRVNPNSTVTLEVAKSDEAESSVCVDGEC